MKPSVTLKDVAQHAGVSPTIVSRVIEFPISKFSSSKRHTLATARRCLVVGWAGMSLSCGGGYTRPSGQAGKPAGGAPTPAGGFVPPGSGTFPC